ncbi:hypothetical protein TVAG_426330 [Trichomonas vaginalis G3]|uniref:RecA family profile 1 domain-containing protein n=1 Tax=Trichomonas vaginalis (strain ATCC PRA-98 / G3) TaxID=412133 RepID=A2DYQ0_TRIV3|nr:strand invasion protein family [Trichomonas vaginalis G3]EAY14440.1 hypothetical protein TVAG_426330 [Trichomonas vaginalis G3]KAI5499947.1 strand invasion protein family [Trichomonas vaginalis G3]|eukprot:XP_001326663.1 hypothetical protein [Trichomonas vaginalis G3]
MDNNENFPCLKKCLGGKFLCQNYFMQERVVLDFDLTQQQKEILADHNIWSYNTLSDEEKSYITEKLSLGNFVKLPKQFLVPSDDLLTYTCGYDAIDRLFSPLISGVVTEICGIPGSGRTSLCLRYADSISNTHSTLWIDTEGGLCVPKDLKLHVLRVLDHPMLFSLTRTIPKLVNDIGNVGLIVIDSIAAPLRGQAVEMQGDRTSMLWELVKVLKSIAISKGIAVLITNHLSTVPFHGNVPSLGHSWSHACTHRVEIKKSNIGRILRILKSPCLVTNDISFENDNDVV